MWCWSSMSCKVQWWWSYPLTKLVWNITLNMYWRELIYTCVSWQTYKCQPSTYGAVSEPTEWLHFLGEVGEIMKCLFRTVEEVRSLKETSHSLWVSQKNRNTVIATLIHVRSELLKHSLSYTRTHGGQSSLAANGYCLSASCHTESEYYSPPGLN